MANDWRLQGGHLDSARPGSFALVTSHGAVDPPPRRAHLARDLPLVAIGTTAMAPFTVGWDPVLRAFVLPRRWCVERTFSWINRCRRTVRDYERLPQHHAAMIQWAMITLMTRRLAHHHT